MTTEVATEVATLALKEPIADKLAFRHECVFCCGADHSATGSEGGSIYDKVYFRWPGVRPLG